MLSSGVRNVPECAGEVLRGLQQREDYRCFPSLLITNVPNHGVE